MVMKEGDPLPLCVVTAYFFILGTCTAYDHILKLPTAFQNKTHNVFDVSISMMKIKNTVWGMHMHRLIVRFQHVMLYSL